MLDVFFGNDTIAVRAEAMAHLAEWRGKGAGITAIEENSYEPGAIEAAARGATLFNVPQAYLIDTPRPGTPFYEEVIANLSDLAESNSQFIVVLPSLLAAEKKRFEKYADTLKEHKGAAKERFNNFALADALAKKDKRSLWVLFNEARMSGVALEELSGVLWWQLKTLRLAAVTDTAAEAGMKDFPYQKAKRSLSNFRPGEPAELSRSLLTVIHDSRLGRHDLDQALERWILSL